MFELGYVCPIVTCEASVACEAIVTCEASVTCEAIVSRPCTTCVLYPCTRSFSFSFVLPSTRVPYSVAQVCCDLLWEVPLSRLEVCVYVCVCMYVCMTCSGKYRSLASRYVYVCMYVCHALSP